jgi:hypothetical protein
MNKLMKMASLGLVLLAIGVVNSATAAPPIGTAKARGDYSNKFWSQSGGRSIRHARDYSSGYRTYARQAPTISPQIAQHEAKGVGDNIAAAKKQFGELRKVTTDKETLASLDAIDKHLAEATKAHAKMHEMCHMETIDGAGVMKCCDDVDAALAKAQAEHEKMTKKLEGGAAAAPAPSK